MKKPLQQRFKRLIKNTGFRYLLSLLIVIVVSMGLVGCSIGFWMLSYQNKIYPGVQVTDLDIGGLDKLTAERRLKTLSQDYLSFSQLEVDTSKQATNSSILSTSLELETLGVVYDHQATVEAAFSLGRDQSWWTNLQTIWRLYHQSENLPLIIDDYHQEHLDSFIDQLADAVEKPGAQPELILNQTTNSFDVFPGEDGLIIDRQAVYSQVESRLKYLNRKPITLSLEYEDHRITDNQISLAKTRALSLIDDQLLLEVHSMDGSIQDSWQLEGAELVTFINLKGGYDLTQITDYLENLAEGINKPPANAAFDFEDGRVVNFVPATYGLGVEIESNVNSFVTSLSQLEADIDIEPLVLKVTQVPPEIDTSDVNNLGIKELLGRGYSTYRGSIPGRIHNVALTASKLNGVLIPPGEVFSFNQTVGEISRATGYQSAYIISGGRTILGDGGGVCQDSTTLFRAVLDAGLPIIERKAHSYRVSYYEQTDKPGFDATVFSPTVDLKFKNDTPGHILIQAKADSDNVTLVIELYGTDDGRVSEITNYRQWDAVPAPPPLYQDDPSLGPGQVKQIDWASPGLKVKFDYIVTRDNETLIEDTFYSNYRPWQAVYLRGV